MIVRGYDFNFQDSNKNNCFNNKKTKNNILYEKHNLNISKPIRYLYLSQLQYIKFKGNYI